MPALICIVGRRIVSCNHVLVININSKMAYKYTRGPDTIHPLRRLVAARVLSAGVSQADALCTGMVESGSSHEMEPYCSCLTIYCITIELVVGEMHCYKNDESKSRLRGPNWFPLGPRPGTGYGYGFTAVTFLHAGDGNAARRLRPGYTSRSVTQRVLTPAYVGRLDSKIWQQ
ncbi:hypothetical protein J6590_007160 [Homalodisca vitripennis]|nr:hypothetical protein J6590_007160 [Homalodisca vitripennis]